MIKTMYLKTVVVLGALAGLLGACSNTSLPLGPSGSTARPGFVETITPDVMFSPKTAAMSTASTAWWGAPSGTTVFSYFGGASSNVTASVVSGTAENGVWVLGVGGTDGKHTLDYFWHWVGHKGTDPSLDYSNTQMFFIASGAGAPVNLTQYKGFVFFARGNGNFGVQVMAGNNKPASPHDSCYPNCPYQDYNFYEYVFGNPGPTWTEYIVYFSDMSQLYGFAAPRSTVLKSATGLQFQQETPYVPNFTLDVDYIRFFQ